MTYYLQYPCMGENTWHVKLFRRQKIRRSIYHHPVLFRLSGPGHGLYSFDDKCYYIPIP